MSAASAETGATAVIAATVRRASAVRASATSSRRSTPCSSSRILAAANRTRADPKPRANAGLALFLCAPIPRALEHEKTMKAIEITSYGAPEVLRLAERPDPVAGTGEALIRVGASGVNRPDVLQRTGNYPVPPGASDLPGLEVAGEIVAGDAQALAAAGLSIGDRVLRAGGQWRLCATVRGAGGPVSAGARGLERHRGGIAARDLLHRLEQRVPARAPAARRETLLVQGGTATASA